MVLQWQRRYLGGRERRKAHEAQSQIRQRWRELLTSMDAIRGPAFAGVRGRTVLNQAENILYIALQDFSLRVESRVGLEERGATMYL